MAVGRGGPKLSKNAQADVIDGRRLPSVAESWLALAPVP